MIKKIPSFVAVIIFIFLLPSCKIKKVMIDNEDVPVKFIDAQGHRGCRGLMPENTIPAFMLAMELGVTTLELDVVISKDEEVIISHEPFFHHHITTLSNGYPVLKNKEKDHNIYQLTLEEIKQYDVGLRPHPKFERQKKVAATKPSLKELVVAVQAKAQELKSTLPYFNIEIKRKPGQDHLFHPTAIVFAQLVLEALSETGIKDRTFIQSFDPESLEAVRELDNTIPLVFLVANRKSVRKNLSCLSFTPEVYSPYYKTVTQDLVNYCKAKGMKLIPWTVNKEKEMINLLDLGVNGIISDYPDVLIKVIKDKEGYEMKK